MTDLLFRDDAYAKENTASIVSINNRGGIILDRTVFYPTAGGQPGDKGQIGSVPIVTTVYDENRNVVHVPGEGNTGLTVGDKVIAQIDWRYRYRVMRCHTLMHLLCAAVPYPVTGSAITDDGGRIDFDIPDGQIPLKEALTETINAWISESHAVTTKVISEAELDSNPALVRTVFVKPPRGSGHIRLVMIGEDGKVDLQPCGGTHVAMTREIGRAIIAKIENKGKINRRIRLALSDG
jgi:misacylated tRNA(Ala) deacylase